MNGLGTRCSLFSRSCLFVFLNCTSILSINIVTIVNFGILFSFHSHSHFAQISSSIFFCFVLAFADGLPHSTCQKRKKSRRLKSQKCPSCLRLQSLLDVQFSFLLVFVDEHAEVCVFGCSNRRRSRQCGTRLASPLTCLR